MHQRMQLDRARGPQEKCMNEVKAIAFYRTLIFQKAIDPKRLQLLLA